MILRPYKKIKELQEKIENLEYRLKLYQESEKEQKQKEELQKHKTGVWCNGCKNLVKEKTWNIVQGTYEEKFCKLKNPCEDRKE